LSLSGTCSPCETILDRQLSRVCLKVKKINDGRNGSPI
jgi:hypothetical protein